MKTMVKNVLGDKTVTHYLPMTAANAATFCADILDGTYKIFEETSKVGTDTAVVAANLVNLQLVNTTTQAKTYLRMIAKANKSSDDIRTALTGLTLNGVVVDKVVVINFQPLTFA